MFCFIEVTSNLSSKMSKRVADKELTDRNWQDEDEPEEVCGGVLKNISPFLIFILISN